MANYGVRAHVCTRKHKAQLVEPQAGSAGRFLPLRTEPCKGRASAHCVPTDPPMSVHCCNMINFPV